MAKYNRKIKKVKSCLQEPKIQEVTLSAWESRCDKLEINQLKRLNYYKKTKSVLVICL